MKKVLRVWSALPEQGEYIAPKANAEVAAKAGGTPFHHPSLADETAVLACMADVDLNPSHHFIRATWLSYRRP